MSDDESFLARWSRRKRGAAPTARDRSKPANGDGGAASEASASASPSLPPETRPPADLASLPPIASIDAASDVRAFLAAGVPADLTRAALRQAWAADPAIRDFIGLSENSWDFNAPGGVPGFGSVKVEDVRRLAARVMGEPEAADDAPSAGPAAAPASPRPAAQDPAHDGSERDGDAGALPRDPPPQDSVTVALDREAGERDCGALLPRRGHGGALPE